MCVRAWVSVWVSVCACEFGLCFHIRKRKKLRGEKIGAFPQRHFRQRGNLLSFSRFLCVHTERETHTHTPPRNPATFYPCCCCVWAFFSFLCYFFVCVRVCVNWTESGVTAERETKTCFDRQEKKQEFIRITCCVLDELEKLEIGKQHFLDPPNDGSVWTGNTLTFSWPEKIDNKKRIPKLLDFLIFFCSPPLCVGVSSFCSRRHGDFLSRTEKYLVLFCVFDSILCYP